MSTAECSEVDVATYVSFRKKDITMCCSAWPSSNDVRVMREIGGLC